MAFNEDEAYMKLAEKEAMVALGEREVPVGCVVVRNGEVIARGHNRTNLELDPTRHAELVAIDSLLAEQHEVVNPHPALCSLAIDISLITRERAIQLGVHSALSAPVVPERAAAAGVKHASSAGRLHPVRDVRAVHHVRHCAIHAWPVSPPPALVPALCGMPR